MVHRLELTLIDEFNGDVVPDATVKFDTGGEPQSLSSGSGGLAVIELTAVPRHHLSVRVQKTGYVPKLVVWDLQRPDRKLPDQFTLKMEAAQTIGGFVQNQKGEPVEGANVLIILRGSSSDQEAQPSIHNEIWERRAHTDASGKWEFHEAAKDLEPLSLRLEHPEYISNEPIETLPPLEEFSRGTAVLTILRGVPCEGVVTDEEGRPIEGVEVISGEGAESSCTVPTRKTNARGHYRFGGLSMKRHYEGIILSFLKDGFAPELITLELSSGSIRKDVVLRRGKPLRVRFVDKEGAPVKGVMFLVTHWRQHRAFHLRFDSNADGLSEWLNAPEDAVGFTALHESYQRLEVRLTAKDEILTIVLQRPAGISGSVVNALTRAPILEFRVTMGRCFHGEHSFSDWSHTQARSFRDGRFHIAASSPVMMMNRDGGPGVIGFRRFRVEAPGYKPAVSREIANEEEDVVCNFELEVGVSLEGTVRDADGNPVPDADVVVSDGGNPVVIQNGEFRYRHNFFVKTDEQGCYVLPPQEEDYSILVIHGQSGYFITTWNGLQASPDMRLLKWGRLELATTGNEKSPLRYYVRPANERENMNARIRFDSTPTQLANGLLIFEGLPAGLMRLGEYYRPVDAGQVIEIESGTTLSLDLRSGRRSVTGQILLPAEGVSIKEPLAHLRLRRTEPFSESTFQIDAQGRFRIDGVEPGGCQLVAIFFRQMPQGRDANPDVVGLAFKEFSLPGGEGDFDLGTLALLPPDAVRST